MFCLVDTCQERENDTSVVSTFFFRLRSGMTRKKVAPFLCQDGLEKTKNCASCYLYFCTFVVPFILLSFPPSCLSFGIFLFVPIIIILSLFSKVYQSRKSYYQTIFTVCVKKKKGGGGNNAITFQQWLHVSVSTLPGKSWYSQQKRNAFLVEAWKYHNPCKDYFRGINFAKSHISWDSKAWSLRVSAYVHRPCKGCLKND